jgi:hypothetical protein
MEGKWGKLHNEELHILKSLAANIYQNDQHNEIGRESSMQER